MGAINTWMPLTSFILSLVFAALVFKRYLARKGPHLLLWGIGLVFYGIGGFCEAVKAIASYLGCRTFITQAADVAGLVEAFENKADIMMLSDDDRFVALHAKSRRIIDNAVATGKGFTTGLNLMAGGLRGRDVLVIGCGPVGSSATEHLVRIGARVSVYDINQRRCNDVAESIGQRLNSKIRSLSDLDTALVDARFIVDASPAANIILAHHITPETYISAPGVPIGLTAEAYSKMIDRILHDPLQIGVATMLVCALKEHVDPVK